MLAYADSAAYSNAQLLQHFGVDAADPQALDFSLLALHALLDLLVQAHNYVRVDAADPQGLDVLLLYLL